jgi:hypothetical protein
VQGAVPIVVMVTVYVPGAFTVATLVLPPDTIDPALGPAHEYEAEPIGAVNVTLCPEHTCGAEGIIFKGSQPAST